MLSLLLSYAEPEGKQGKEEKPELEANFALSGKVAAESDTVKGVVLMAPQPDLPIVTVVRTHCYCRICVQSQMGSKGRRRSPSLRQTLLCLASWQQRATR